MRNSRGSAALEAVGTIAFAVVALGAGCVFTYAAFAHQWLKHAAYEASICLSTPSSKSDCESALRRTTQMALPIGKLETISLSKGRTNVKTELRWRLNKEVVLAIDDVRSVPLLGKRPF